MKKKEQALVISQEMLADGIFSMWIRTDAANAAKPGQFLSMYTDDGTKLLPRPISICEIDRDGEALRMVYRVTGPETGTEQFSRLQAGDKIEIVGPLGNGFPLEKAAGKRAMLMGGGIGVPPILELAKELAADSSVLLEIEVDPSEGDLRSVLQEMPEIQSVGREEDRYVISAGRDIGNELLSAAMAAGCRIQSMRHLNNDLEEIYRRYFEKAEQEHDKHQNNKRFISRNFERKAAGAEKK